MITVTESAKIRFKEIASAKYVGDLVLRLEPVKHASPGNVQVGMYIGEPREDDQIVKYEGESLIHVSSWVCKAHDGCVIDLVEKPEGLGFSIGPPMAGQYAR